MCPKKCAVTRGESAALVADFERNEAGKELETGRPTFPKILKLLFDKKKEEIYRDIVAKMEK